MRLLFKKRQVQNDLTLIIDATYGFSRASVAGILKEWFIGTREGWEAVVFILEDCATYDREEKIQKALWDRLSGINFEWIPCEGSEHSLNGVKNIVNRMAYILWLYLGRLDRPVIFANLPDDE